MSKRTGIGAKDWGYEVSLESLPVGRLAKLLRGDVHSDPTMEAAIAEQELCDDIGDSERAAITVENASMVINKFWAMADFYGSQWQMLKRERDLADGRRKSGRATVWANGIGARKSCSALQKDAKRSRCTNDAKYVYSSKTKNGNYSYQRRCQGCYEKVKDKSKYRPIADGRYFSRRYRRKLGITPES